MIAKSLVSTLFCSTLTKSCRIHKINSIVSNIGLLKRPPCITNTVNLASVSRRNRETKNVPDNSGFDPSKAKIVLLLNLKTPEDAVPFYKLPVRTLLHIYKTTKDDGSKGYCKNRLYYIASRINVPSSVLSEKLAKRTFIYGLSFEWIKNALDVLTELNVPGERILRDLWVLKYHHETIRERLQRVKDLGIDNLYPWMVRCNEDILKRFISISRETKNILGESKSTQTYLADRLNTSLDTVEEMCIKIPALKTIRVTKVKNFLDFLINEGFDVEDITNKPRVLSASQKTVKQRLEKLRELGLNEINLNVLCRSKKHFKKYCESLSKESQDNT